MKPEETAKTTDSGIVVTEKAPDALRADIAQTRTEMSGTLSAIQERLKPANIDDKVREEVREHLRAATDAAKEELRLQYEVAKETVRQEVTQQFHAVKSEVKEQFFVAKSEVKEQFDAAKTEVREQIQAAKATVREATIGRIETMMQTATNTATEARITVADTIRANPIPAAMVGFGLAWLLMSGSRGGGSARGSARRLPQGAGRGGQRVLVYHPVHGYMYANVNSGSPPAYGYGEGRYGEARPGYGGQMAAGMHDAQQGLGQAAHNVTDAAGRAVHNVTDAAGRAVHNVQDTAGRVAQNVQETAGRVAHNVTDSAGRVVQNVQETAGRVAHNVTDAAGRAVHNVTDAAGRVVHNVQDTAGQWAHSVADTTGQLVQQGQQWGHQAQESAGQFVHEVGDRAHQLETRFEGTLRDNPLAVGAVALAIGAAVGLMLPSTRREDEWMGDTRDQLFEQAQGVAQQTLGKVENVAQQLVENGGNRNGAGASVQQQSLALRAQRRGIVLLSLRR